MTTERQPVFAAVPWRGCVVVTACAAKPSGARTPTEGYSQDVRCGLAPLSLRPPTPVRPWHARVSFASTRVAASDSKLGRSQSQGQRSCPRVFFFDTSESRPGTVHERRVANARRRKGVCVTPN